MKQHRMAAGAAVAAVMLLAGACGDDSDGDGDAAAPAAGEDIEETVDAATGDADIDPCTLLEIEEIEAEFGDAGPVLDGEQQFDQCTWLVGEDQSEPGTGTVHVFVQYIDPSLPSDDAPDIFAEQQSTTPGAEPVSGLGDGAYFTPNAASVDFLIGDRILFVQAAFIPERPDVRESLETLAQLVAGRI